MAKLSAAQRRAVPKSKFGVPEKAPKSGSYPMPDKKHARAAIMLSGHAAPSKRAAIKAKARRILKGGGD